MKKLLYFTTIALAGLSIACVNDDDRFYSAEGEGQLVIKPEIKSDIKVVSRAVDDEEYLKESMILWVSNAKGVVRKYYRQGGIPDHEWLLAGNYVAEAWAGDSVSASFDKRWFKGRQEFMIKAGEATTVTLPCRIANVLVEVVYEEGVYELIDQPVFTVGHKRGSLDFVGANPEVGYFMMPSTDKDLRWTFDAKNGFGEDIHMEDVIVDAKAATKYILTVKANNNETLIGGTYFTIEVDTKEVVVDETFAIALAPIIDGYDFDAGEEQVFQPGNIGHKSVVINASAELVEGKLTVAGLSELLGITTMSFDEVDFIVSDPAFLEAVSERGIKGLYTKQEDSPECSLKINFEEEFTDKLPVGEYEFKYYAKDIDGRTSELTSIVRVTNAPLKILPAEESLVWADKATLTTTIMRPNYGNAQFQYREVGNTDWISVSARVQSRADIEAGVTKISAEITGLNPGTTYEYRVICDLDNFESEIMTFTTESAEQLPNSGFEDWNTSSKAWLICTDATSMFWDSGNHGSATMSVNITQNDTSLKHSGSYSVKMESQFVSFMGIGKFAAGNAFVGQYLKTDGTDGILGWGRPFTSRPKALKGYVKYVPKAVTDVESGFDKISKGDLDQGIIYIAILDESMTDAGKDNVENGKSSVWPVIVKTKKSVRKLFSKTDPNVIAYGEKIFTEATAGDGLIEFEIPLEYFKTDVKAANIMVTMSASRYGDYFTGGPSTMWVDDLELVY